MNGLQHDRSIALETQDAPCAARNPKVDANYGVDLGGPITKQFEQTMIAQLEANPSDVFRIVLGYQLLSQLLSQRPLLLSNVAIALQRMNTPASTAQYEKLFEVLMAKAGDAQNVPQLNEVTATLARSQTSSREVIVLHEKCIITISSQRVSRDVIDLCLTQWAQLYTEHGSKLVASLSVNGRRTLMTLALSNASSDAATLYERLA